MPEVRRGSLTQPASAWSSSTGAGGSVGEGHDGARTGDSTAAEDNGNGSAADNARHDGRASTDARRSLSYALRPRADAYYDSRAATRA
ncbi:Uncharacterized protein TPAR_07531, partial [Tolypocladium paradoxum]